MVMLLAIMVGLLFNNKRLDDFRDILRADIGGSKAELQGQINQLRSELQSQINQLRGELQSQINQLRGELGQTKAEVHADVASSEQRILQSIADVKLEIQALGHRVEKLEAPLIRP